MAATLGGIAVNGTLMVLGGVQTMTISPLLMFGRQSVRGWYSGTAIDSEDTMAFSAMTGVRSMNEVFPLEKAAEAYDRMMRRRRAVQGCLVDIALNVDGLEVRASVAGTFHVKRSIFGCLLGRPAALARDDVGGVPPRPVVLRSGRFVLAMVLLCLSQKLCEGCDVHAESSSRKPRLDLLEQPAVAVWIAE